MNALVVRSRAAAQVLTPDLSNPVLADADAHHLARVLRLRDGESVVACDGAGSWRLCEWRAQGGTGHLDPSGEVERDAAPSPRVTVWLSPLKGERAEWAVAKLTELGVDEIGILTCDRAAVPLDAAQTERVLARWRRVAREATCQSRRTRLPEVCGPTPVKGAIDRGAARCDLDGSTQLDEAVTALAVGPEGGWSDRERALDAPSVALSDTVLRTETAAVVAGVTLTSRRRQSGHGGSLGAQ